MVFPGIVLQATFQRFLLEEVRGVLIHEQLKHNRVLLILLIQCPRDIYDVLLLFLLYLKILLRPLCCFQGDCCGSINARSAFGIEICL